MYCSLYNHLFIHVPKCAGTSMVTAMESAGSPSNPGHKTLKKYITQGDVPSDIFKWCFVRNPYDRLFSAYIYHLSRGLLRIEPPTLSTTPDEAYHLTADPFFMNNFESYVLHLKELREMKILHLKEQYSFMSFENITMDFIGRYENIEQDWNYISKKLYNQKLPLDTINDGSQHAALPRAIQGHECFDQRYSPSQLAAKKYISFYTPEMIKIVNEVYNKDFEVFDYAKH